MPKPQKIPCKLHTSNPVSVKHKYTDLAWIISCLDFAVASYETRSESKCTGTWAGFNSLLSSANVSMIPPLIRSPPTNYDTLYTGLKHGVFQQI